MLNILMKKLSLILLISVCLTGCVSTQKAPAPQPAPPAPMAISEAKPAAQNTPAEKPSLLDSSQKIPSTTESNEEDVIPYGVILAKTDFEGVLKAEYVQLMVNGLGENTYNFQLNIGREQEKKLFNRDVKPVEPGYFFMEIPAGRYHIVSVAIPVGSTKAQEDIDVTFSVQPDEVVYLGTLRIVGTKEKIKLGGVPVIKPGFDYTAQILDERDEAFATYQSKILENDKEITVRMMELRGVED